MSRTIITVSIVIRGFASRQSSRYVDYFRLHEGSLKCTEILTHGTLWLTPLAEDGVAEQSVPCSGTAGVSGFGQDCLATATEHWALKRLHRDAWGVHIYL